MSGQFQNIDWCSTKYSDHPFCCSAFRFLPFLLQHLTLVIFQKCNFAFPNPSVPLLFQSLGKQWYYLSSFSSCPLPFAFIHSPPVLQITAVTSHCIFAGSFSAACRTAAVVTQRLREESFAFSFVNSALISSHSWHSQKKSRERVLSWHHTELIY